jgi:hypothetical protein
MAAVAQRKRTTAQTREPVPSPTPTSHPPLPPSLAHYRQRVAVLDTQPASMRAVHVDVPPRTDGALGNLQGALGSNQSQRRASLQRRNQHHAHAEGQRAGADKGGVSRSCFGLLRNGSSPRCRH